MAFRKTDPQFDTLKACPLCGGGRFKTWEASPPGYAVHPLRVRCRDCGLIFSNPQASEKRLKHFYEKIYFEDRQFKGGYFDVDEESRQRAKARAELALLERFVKPGRILDVGAAAGYFLLEARRGGWQAEGVELNAKSVSLARRRGLKVAHARLEDFKTPRRFDVIHAAHTLEHVKDPLLFLKKARGLLAEGGRLMIEVPNAMHLWALIWHYGARLRGRVPPLVYAKEHTFDFTRSTLSSLHAKAGLEIVRLRAYEYPGGALNLWHKKGEGPLKSLARALFVAFCRLSRAEALVGSYLQVFSKVKP